MRAAARRLTDIAMGRVIHGSDEPVFDRDGRRVGRRIEYNDRLVMFMLRALQPDRFGALERPDSTSGEALPPPAPAAPHTLLPPDELGPALQLAELLDGRLRAAHRDDPERDVGENAS